MTDSKSLEQALSEAFHKADALAAPLEERLRLYLAKSRKLLPELEATYAVGEAMPEFCMTDSEGHLVDLASMLATGPLVISFNRGPWCDYCGLELRSLARAYPDIVAAGGEVISIVPEISKYARVLRVTRDLPFRVLTDLDLAYAMSLGLVFWVGEKVKQMYLGFGIDLTQFQVMVAGSCRSPQP